MVRIVTLVLAAGTAAIAAITFGFIAYEILGISPTTIRIEAIATAALIGSALATRMLVDRIFR
jgi:hypothetical protein